MPSFTFNGFTTGSQVAISVAQGADNVSNSVPAWGQGSVNGNLDILTVHAASIAAPALVWFEAINISGFDVSGGPGPGKVHDPSFDGITFVWTVTSNGAPLGDYTAPVVPNAWRKADVAYGKKVAFFFTDPNTTYTVKCWAIDQTGNYGEATTSVVTQSTASVYPGAATICLDPSGSFAGAPSGAQQVTSVGAMQSAINATSSPCCVLIARGQTIAGFQVDGRAGNLRHVGTFGSGNRPVLTTAGSTSSMFNFFQTSGTQLTVEGCDCRGDWDASTETGYPSDNPLETSISSMLHLTVWDCRFDGFKIMNLALRNTTAWLAGYGNTVITNWQDYGVFVATSPLAKIAMVGCDVAQNLQGPNEYVGARNGLMNQQGPVRAPGYETLYIAASSFLSRGGWSGGTDQPCLRLNSDCLEGIGTILDRVVAEGGARTVRMSGSNSSSTEKPGDYLFDKVLLLSGGGKTGFRLANAHFGGVTFRNTLFATLDVPNATGTQMSECVNLSPDQPDAGNFAEPVNIYNCTSLNLRSVANDDGDNPRINNAPSFTDFTEENNVVHGPSLSTPVTANSLDISTNLAGFQARYAGTRPNFPFETGTLGGSVSNGGSFTLPYPSGTNQAYWQAIEAIDFRHGLTMGSTTYFSAYDGRFSVAFEGGQIRITNLSGTTWSGGTNWTLRLDRKSQLPAMNSTHANPANVPVPIPANSLIVTTAGAGDLRAYDDFFGQVRPGPGGQDHLGNVRPAVSSTNPTARGAFLP